MYFLRCTTIFSLVPLLFNSFVNEIFVMTLIFYHLLII
jgi:hypothetical protein